MRPDSRAAGTTGPTQPPTPTPALELVAKRGVASRFLPPIAAAAMILGATIAAASASVPQAHAAKPATSAPPGASPVMTKNVGDLTAEEEEEFARVTEETMQRVCVQCHPFDDIVKTRRLAREWNDQVALMATKGAPGTDAEFAMIKKYLTRYYGIVRVNTAPAEELSSVLGLPSKIAAAAVSYRQAHGPFADLAALSHVEGIDKAKLEEQPEALRFDVPK